MDDLISRRAIIAEFECCELTPDGGIDVNYALDFTKALPSVGPEIIRCKECKHYVDGYIHCNRVTWWNGEDDFCSRAERREK